jgi:hypothetical protein
LKSEEQRAECAEYPQVSQHFGSILPCFMHFSVFPPTHPPGRLTARSTRARRLDACVNSG